MFQNQCYHYTATFACGRTAEHNAHSSLHRSTSCSIINVAIMLPQSYVLGLQDTISKGKRGSRQQCLSHAKRHLLAGSHVIIDRCHVDAEQRRDFVQLAMQLNVKVRFPLLNHRILLLLINHPLLRVALLWIRSSNYSRCMFMVQTSVI